jgi:hypothetical protein
VEGKKTKSGLRREHVLLIGAPRTGTTLLGTMIGSHSEMGMVNEDVDVRALGRVLGRQLTGVKLCVPNQIRLEKKSFLGSQLLKKVGMIHESPKSHLSIKEYLEIPTLKVIAIIRDGNDSVHSMMVRGKSRFKKAARRWAEAVETIYVMKNTCPDRILVLTFENLVLDPRTTIQNVCDFLGIAFEERMLRGHELNPYYPEPELLAEKAQRHNRKELPFDLQRAVPRAVKHFEELVAVANAAHSR